MQVSVQPLNKQASALHFFVLFYNLLADLMYVYALKIDLNVYELSECVSVSVSVCTYLVCVRVYGIRFA